MPRAGTTSCRTSTPAVAGIIRPRRAGRAGRSSRASPMALILQEVSAERYSSSRPGARVYISGPRPLYRARRLEQASTRRRIYYKYEGVSRSQPQATRVAGLLNREEASGKSRPKPARASGGLRAMGRVLGVEVESLCEGPLSQKRSAAHDASQRRDVLATRQIYAAGALDSGARPDKWAAWDRDQRGGGARGNQRRHSQVFARHRAEPRPAARRSWAKKRCSRWRRPTTTRTW